MISVLGELTPHYHTYLCRTNWIGFHVNDSGKFTFAADWGFFLNHNINSRGDLELTSDGIQQIKAHYDESRRSYMKKRDHFRQYGAIHAPYARKRKGQYAKHSRMELVSQLGGTPGWGNWASATDFALSKYYFVNEYGDNEPYPLPQAEDGSNFAFIGWLHSFTYVEPLGCNLELFYHAGQQQALLTFDWS